MRRRYLLIPLYLWATSHPVPEVVEFDASDGHRVFGYLYHPAGEPLATVLAFHQGGGDARGEYDPIAARLTALGFEVLAIDQRNGGDVFGGENRTLAQWSDEPGYCAAYPDLEGALRFARARAGDRPIVLWGSSYSAALALRLAAFQPEGIAGVLAFSPAGLEGCPGEEVSDRIEVPVVVLRPESEMERESSVTQEETFRRQGHDFFVARPGTHGSSMLVRERVEGSVDATWEYVERFLERVVAGSGPG